mgnify:CR=1 FL=1
MKTSIFRISRELDFKRKIIAQKILNKCKSKYPKDETEKKGKIEFLLRGYEDYIFELSKLNIKEGE